jgi:hypothetical protein
MTPAILERKYNILELCCSQTYIIDIQFQVIGTLKMKSTTWGFTYIYMQHAKLSSWTCGSNDTTIAY